MFPLNILQSLNCLQEAKAWLFLSTHHRPSIIHRASRDQTSSTPKTRRPSVSVQQQRAIITCTPCLFFITKKNLEQQRPPSNACELSCVSTRQIRSTAVPRSALLDALGSQRTRAGRRGADAFVYGRALLRVRGEIKADRWIVHHPAAESKHGRGASDRWKKKKVTFTPRDHILRRPSRRPRSRPPLTSFTLNFQQPGSGFD